MTAREGATSRAGRAVVVDPGPLDVPPGQLTGDTLHDLRTRVVAGGRRGMTQNMFWD